MSSQNSASRNSASQNSQPSTTIPHGSFLGTYTYPTLDSFNVYSGPGTALVNTVRRTNRYSDLAQLQPMVQTAGLDSELGMSIVVSNTRRLGFVEAVTASVNDTKFPITGAEDNAPVELKWDSEEANPLRKKITRALRYAIGYQGDALEPKVTASDWQWTSKFVIAIWFHRAWLPIGPPIPWDLPPGGHVGVQEYLSALREIYLAWTHSGQQPVFTPTIEDL